MERNREQYIPGMCNISAQESRKRVRIAITGLLLAFVYALVIWYFELERTWRLPIFIPAFLVAIGYLQARNRFCVLRGMEGESHFGQGKVKESNLEKDRIRAIKLIIYALVIGAFVTAIIYYFPV